MSSQIFTLIFLSFIHDCDTDIAADLKPQLKVNEILLEIDLRLGSKYRIKL